MLTAADINSMFGKFTSAQIAKGITTVLLHDAKGPIPGGFLHALILVGDEGAVLVEHIYTKINLGDSKSQLKLWYRKGPGGRCARERVSPLRPSRSRRRVRQFSNTRNLLRDLSS